MDCGDRGEVQVEGGRARRRAMAREMGAGGIAVNVTGLKLTESVQFMDCACMALSMSPGASHEQEQCSRPQGPHRQAVKAELSGWHASVSLYLQCDRCGKVSQHRTTRGLIRFLRMAMTPHRTGTDTVSSDGDDTTQYRYR